MQVAIIYGCSAIGPFFDADTARPALQLISRHDHSAYIVPLRFVSDLPNVILELEKATAGSAPTAEGAECVS